MHYTHNPSTSIYPLCVLLRQSFREFFEKIFEDTLKHGHGRIAGHDVHFEDVFHADNDDYREQVGHEFKAVT